MDLFQIRWLRLPGCYWLNERLLFPKADVIKICKSEKSPSLLCSDTIGGQMMLQRLTDALRKQTWSTVLLEIMILVVGIFIGLQVDDWNRYRQDRNDEIIYLNRLHDELLNADKLSARVLDRRIERQQLLFGVLEVVFDDPDRQSLTADECMTAGSLHFFNVVVSGLSAAEELTASGRMSILLDAELRAALGALRQVHNAADTYIRIQNDVANNLTHLYPELIKVRAYYDEDLREVYARFSCDLPAMRQNPSFLNDFSNNADAYDAYVRDALSPWDAQIRLVHDLLDRNLRLNHAN